MFNRGGILFIISALEIVLRVKFGFCDAPLAISSEKYEYAFAPSQDRHRFGNHVYYNSYSQRSEEPDSSKIIVLGLGDSVINGGVQTDQSDLATTISSDENIQILNISAGSWGPDNCAAYLEEQGTFEAKKMLLVVSSHDAHDIMDFQPIVGVHASYPIKQYSFAIVELFDRYLLPRIYKKKIENLDPDKKVENNVGSIVKGYGQFNPGFDRLKSIADSMGIEMAIYLHPDRIELSDGEFNSQGQEIIDWAKNNNISLTSGFEMGESLTTLRDGIHLNQNGQRILANWMKQQTVVFEK